MAVKVPHNRLSPEALKGVIEQFISRDGTDSGHIEISFEKKFSNVKKQLDSGRAVILFDQTTGSCNIISNDEFQTINRNK